MRYFSLAMIAVGALMFPFAAKKAILGLSASEATTELRNALILLIIGLLMIGVGWFVAKRDEITTSWRNRNRSTRIKLR